MSCSTICRRPPRRRIVNGWAPSSRRWQESGAAVVKIAPANVLPNFDTQAQTQGTVAERRGRCAGSAAVDSMMELLEAEQIAAMYEGLTRSSCTKSSPTKTCCRWHGGRLPEPFDPAIVGSFADRNLRVLQAVLGARRAWPDRSKPTRTHPHAADIMRLEMKMNLLLDMVGALLIASRPRPKPAAVRFNALGGGVQVPHRSRRWATRACSRSTCAIASPIRCACSVASLR